MRLSSQIVSRGLLRDSRSLQVREIPLRIDPLELGHAADVVRKRCCAVDVAAQYRRTKGAAGIVYNCRGLISDLARDRPLEGLTIFHVCKVDVDRCVQSARQWSLYRRVKCAPLDFRDPRSVESLFAWIERLWRAGIEHPRRAW